MPTPIHFETAEMNIRWYQFLSITNHCLFLRFWQPNGRLFRQITSAAAVIDFFLTKNVRMG